MKPRFCLVSHVTWESYQLTAKETSYLLHNANSASFLLIPFRKSGYKLHYLIIIYLKSPSKKTNKSENALICILVEPIK